VIRVYEAVKELWDYRELFYFFVWRDIKVRYKQTVLGASWAIIQPFFTMVVFTLLFGRLADMPSDGIPYPVFSYSALVPWTYFAASLSLTGNSLVANANLITKVYFPRMALPASATLSGLVDYAIASLVLLAMMVYYDIQPSLELFFWPLWVIPLVFLSLGAGMVLAALNVKYRDIKYTIPFLVQLWLFLSPVIYPTSIIPGRFRFLSSLNPVSGIIEAFRASLIPDKHIDWQLLTTSILLSLLVFVLGWLFFTRTERSFADII
jgi:lipopolysaccharide transport system permease protein